MGIPKTILLTTICVFLLLLNPISITTAQKQLQIQAQIFGPFNSSYYDIFDVKKDATISGQALQITPDTLNDNFNLLNRSGRVLFNKPFKLWEGSTNTTTITSFNPTSLINIFRPQNQTAGEGISFIIAPNLDIPTGSEGQWLGLTNATIDGNASNRFIAVELDTVKQSFDINDNHISLDINSVRSVVAYNVN